MSYGFEVVRPFLCVVLSVGPLTWQQRWGNALDRATEAALLALVVLCWSIALGLFK